MKRNSEKMTGRKKTSSDPGSTGVRSVTDFKLQQVNENELKSVKNKRGN
jgi:hypothetical protein